MYVYFIRHGETLHNRKGVHQDGSVMLSDRGREQLKKTGEYLRGRGITKLITSDLARAEESARIVGNELQLVPEPNELFREVRRPSQLFGRRHVSLKTLTTGLSILLRLHDRHWHYSDEENLYDLRERVFKAVEYLKTLRGEHEHVAVVSHAFITTTLIKYMCRHKKVRVRDYVETLFSAKKLANGSVSTLRLSDDEDPETCDWVCLNLNEHKHLKT